MAITYLDHAAATPLLPSGTAAHAELCRRYFYNPHAASQLSAECLCEVRRAETRLLACLGLGTEDAEVVWTSGGTESLNLAILGTILRPPARLFVDATAHRALLEPARAAASQAGVTLATLPVDAKGRLDLGPPPEGAPGALVGVGHVNNETGAVHDLVAVRRWIERHAPGAALIVDALQSLGKLPVPWGEAALDLLAVGGRKIGGPPAVGALIVRRGRRLRPLLHGGGQQRGLRAGTLDTVGILEFTLAAECACGALRAQLARAEVLNRRLRERLAGAVRPPPVVLSPPDASPYILSFAFPGLEGAVLMRKLAARGVIVATGSACTAESRQSSHVLAAMGIAERTARGALRVSFGASSQEEDVENLVRELQAALDSY